MVRMDRRKPPKIADLFPEESEERRCENEEAFERYFKIVMRIGDRLHLDLTRNEEDSNMEGRSNINNPKEPNV